jgi:hypothetical protein
MAKGNLNSLQYSLCETARLSKYNVAVLIVEEPKLNQPSDRGLRRYMLKTVSLCLKHIQAGRRVAAEKRLDAVILPDFSTEFLLLTYLFSGGRTQNVYALIHHNAQQALHSHWMRRLLKFYNFLGYKFILNETLAALTDLGDDAPANWGNAVLLHPVQAELMVDRQPADRQHISDPSPRPQVGIVGSVRKGKRFEETLLLLRQLQQRLDFTLIVGVDQPALSPHLQPDDRLIIRDTAQHDQYLSVLAACDVIVLNYDESQYRYRCSGVAADAIGTKTYVVAPDYPMIRHQLVYPATVGVLYQGTTDLEAELEMALQTALKLPPAQTNPAFAQHYAARSPEGLASSLDRILASQLDRQTPRVRSVWRSLRRSVAYPKSSPSK